MWRDILGRTDFGVNDNFFDLGGSSVLMLQIQAAIRQEYGCEISLAALFSAPTVAGVALLLRGSSGLVSRTLVQLGGTGCLSAFFFHPVGGSTAIYRPLATELDGYRCYGLQALGLCFECQPQDRLADMTGTYIEDIRAAAPDGPDVFIGYSLGAILALAAAKRLEETGVRPPLVVLVDPPVHLRSDLSDTVVPYQAIGFPLGLDLDYETISLLPVSQGVKVIYQAGLRSGTYSEAFPIRTLYAIFETARANLRAAGEYTPEPYAGRIVIVRSVASTEPVEWLREGAEPIAASIPLPHAMLLEEKGARRIAKLLLPILEAAVKGA
jgi:thioesterase domain-containing protein/aryl carrier-like protein